MLGKHKRRRTAVWSLQNRTEQSGAALVAENIWLLPVNGDLESDHQLVVGGTIHVETASMFLTQIKFMFYLKH